MYKKPKIPLKRNKDGTFHRGQLAQFMRWWFQEHPELRGHKWIPKPKKF